jgi:hypothetical protein
MTRYLLLLLSMGLAAPRAMAAGFQAKTMRETLPAREVERSLLIGKGWLEFGLGTDVKVAEGSWSAEGKALSFDDKSSWLYTTERLDIRYGIARRVELYWRLKTHYVHLENPERKTDISQFGLGDPNFGVKYELYRSLAPISSIVVYGDYKAPAGNESPGNYVGGPSTFSAVVLTTGTQDLTAGVQAKQQVGPLALMVDAGYTRRLSGIVQYVIETELNQFSGRIKPGDVFKLDGDLLLQAGPVALDGGVLYRRRDVTEIGTTVDGWFPGKDLQPIEGSDGWSLDAKAGLTLNITRGLDLVGAATLPVRGEDLQFWPIEDIHPTRGNTYSGTLEFRY